MGLCLILRSMLFTAALTVVTCRAKIVKPAVRLSGPNNILPYISLLLHPLYSITPALRNDKGGAKFVRPAGKLGQIFLVIRVPAGLI